MINQCDQLDCLGVGHSGGLGVVWHRGRLCILQWSEVVAANLALLARGAWVGSRRCGKKREEHFLHGRVNFLYLLLVLNFRL